MKLHLGSLIGFATFVALIVSGCGLSHPPSGYFAFSDPQNGSVYCLDCEIHIDVKASNNFVFNSNWTEIEVEFFDNGALLADIPEPPNTRDVGLRVPHETPGVHIFSAKARGVLRTGTDPWYQAQQVCIFVGQPSSNLYDACGPSSTQQSGDGGGPIGTLAEPLVVASTLTPTPISVIDSAQAYPSPIYYGETCPSLSTVTFRSALTLPNGIESDQVQVAAHASFIISSPANPSGSLLVQLLPNGTWDTSSGGQVFVGTVALTHSYNDANNQFDPASLGGSSGAILWYVSVTRNDSSGQGSELARSGNQVIDLAPCPSGQSNPSRNGNNGTAGNKSGCAQYTNQTSCNLAGCSWNGSSCTVNP